MRSRRRVRQFLDVGEPAVHTEGMSRQSARLCCLALCFAMACGGLRGGSPRVEPSSSNVASHARVAMVTREQKPLPTAKLAPTVVEVERQPSAAAPSLPEAVETRLAREYPLYGVAYHVLAQVFVEPSPEALVSGYFRRGGVLRVKPGVRAKGCDSLWHEVLGGGYVCAGRGFLIGKTPQTFTPSPSLPDMHEPMPYAYGKTLAPDVAQYFRVPNADEERDVSAAIALQTAAARTASEIIPDKQASSSVLSKSLDPKADVAQAKSAETQPFPSLLRMVMQPGFYVSVDGREPDPSGERELVRTVRGAYVRADALSDVAIPALTGTRLSAETPFPIGLVYRANTPSFRRDPTTGAMLAAEPLQLMQSFSLGKESVLQAGRRYRVTRDGLFVPEDVLRVVNKVARPPLVSSRARWIDIELSTQTLVAYEGDKPVFATLVSTGKEGHETPPGIFRIQGKHVSTTMDGEAGTDEAYSIEDVPWTMYYSGSLALHAAFWHKSFGRTRSHGCVNLAPADAHFLFDWTTPGLPSGFHGVVATRPDVGTFVVINP